MYFTLYSIEVFIFNKFNCILLNFQLLLYIVCIYLSDMTSSLDDMVDDFAKYVGVYLPRH